MWNIKYSGILRDSRDVNNNKLSRKFRRAPLRALSVALSSGAMTAPATENFHSTARRRFVSFLRSSASTHTAPRTPNTRRRRVRARPPQTQLRQASAVLVRVFVVRAVEHRRCVRGEQPICRAEYHHIDCFSLSGAFVAPFSFPFAAFAKQTWNCASARVSETEALIPFNRICSNSVQLHNFLPLVESESKRTIIFNKCTVVQCAAAEGRRDERRDSLLSQDSLCSFGTEVCSSYFLRFRQKRKAIRMLPAASSAVFIAQRRQIVSVCERNSVHVEGN